MDTKVLIFLAHILLFCSSSMSSPVGQFSSEYTEVSMEESKSKRTLNQDEFPLDSIKMDQLLQEVEELFLRNFESPNFEENINNHIISTFRIH